MDFIPQITNKMLIIGDIKRSHSLYHRIFNLSCIAIIYWFHNDICVVLKLLALE